jgi:predicted membrane protein
LFAMIVYLISVRFGFHLCFISKILLFALSLICLFNLVSTHCKIYLFIYISTTIAIQNQKKGTRGTMQDDIRKLEIIFFF